MLIFKNICNEESIFTADINKPGCTTNEN